MTTPTTFSTPPTPPVQNIGKSLAWSSIGIGILIVAIVGGTCFQQGFVAAGRCATMLIMPVSIVWLGLLAASLWQAGLRQHRKAVLLALLFVVWSILGNEHFVKTMMARTEATLETVPHPALEKREFDAGQASTRLPLDAVVTLGGAANLVLHDFPEVGNDGERVVSAAQAYLAGATRTIITTGSSTDGIGNPSEVSRDLLISLGVPATKIFTIQGQNTTQEMQALAEFLRNPPHAWLTQLHPEKPVGSAPQATPLAIGLITSAYHIPRAMRLAQAQHLNLIPLPCAFRTLAIKRPWLASDLVPTAENLDQLGLAIKEKLASVVGR